MTLYREAKEIRSHHLIPDSLVIAILVLSLNLTQVNRRESV